MGFVAVMSFLNVDLNSQGEINEIISYKVPHVGIDSDIR